MLRRCSTLLLPIILCFLCMPAFAQKASAHAPLPQRSHRLPYVVPGSPIVSASLQAPNNIWYTGNGIDPSNYLLVKHWNGKTFDAPLRNAAPFQISDAGQAVLALSPTQTWVIANGFTDQNPLRIIYLHGSSQTTYPSPPVHGEVVNAMAAVNADDVWAVGSSGPLTDTFTMHWNGKSWQRIASPNIPNKYSSLWGVSARTTNDVWAVGSQQGTNGGDLPLIMHWNGKAWTITPSPSLPVLPAHALNAVTIVSQDDVWAVGLGGLIEHWNGSQWKIVSSPLAKPNFLSLNALSALTANDIWVVGQTIACPSSDNCTTLAHTEHWNGKTWRSIPGPSLSSNNQSSDGLLFGVRMFSADDVWTIGKEDDTVFLAHWNGKTWQIPTSHNVYF